MSGVGAAIPPYTCAGCFGVGHPTGMCPFKKIPNWKDPVLYGLNEYDHRGRSAKYQQGRNNRAPANSAMPMPTTPMTVVDDIRKYAKIHYLFNEPCEARTKIHGQESQICTLTAPRGRAGSPAAGSSDDQRRVYGNGAHVDTNMGGPANGVTQSNANGTPDPLQPMAGARKKITKNTRARIKIASLNMRGFGNNTSNNKWNNLHRLIKEDHIGVLALQETHLTNENVDGLHAQYGRRLKIIHTSDPDDPS
ncbi:hypothetical protein K474DRAFT_1677850 [Panus rudis PR-1116 ss-1]|nr:hypothetical protein K474DRAFT_1677850 [Panus rudis PR-1116 ss-1]